MQNKWMILKSFGIVLFLVGVAQLASTQSNSPKTSNDRPTLSEIQSFPIKQENKAKALSTKKDNTTTDYIIGTWVSTYSSSDFSGDITYRINKKEETFYALVKKYEMKDGYIEKGNNEKILTIKNFDGYKAKCIYLIEYSKEKYDVECQLNMLDENSFLLSYDFYGYFEETWKRIKK